MSGVAVGSLIGNWVGSEVGFGVANVGEIVGRGDEGDAVGCNECVNVDAVGAFVGESVVGAVGACVGLLVCTATTSPVDSPVELL